MKLKKLNTRGMAHEAVTMLFVGVFAIGGVGLLVASHANKLPLLAGKCSIAGVPNSVDNGVTVTPTIVVDNVGQKSFTTTVNVVESLVSKAGGKGGGSETTVTVPAGGSVQFKGGTLTAQTGYKIVVTANSTTPQFSCSATAKAV